MAKSMQNRRTPPAARQGCVGCLTIVAIILIAIVSISQLIEMNKNKSKQPTPKKSPAASEVRPSKVPDKTK